MPTNCLNGVAITGSACSTLPDQTIGTYSPTTAGDAYSADANTSLQTDEVEYEIYKKGAEIPTPFRINDASRYLSYGVQPQMLAMVDFTVDSKLAM